MKRLTILSGMTAALVYSASVAAQAPAGSGTVPPPATGGQAQLNQRIAGVASQDVSATGFEDPNSPFEKKDTAYYFVGARFRYVIIPKFYTGLFGDGGATVGAPAGGPEFTIRKNGFEYVLSAMFASYSLDPTPFKSKTDKNDAWEIVDANLKTIYLMSDFLWSAETSPKFAFIYGGGIGLGFVFGDIHRVQAYPPDGTDVNNGYTYQRCTAQGVPHPFCGRDNDHYGNYTEASWANGGSKPLLFPWLSLQTGFRFKPSRQFMGRFDIGWNILNGPFFGLALNYGLPAQQ